MGIPLRTSGLTPRNYYEGDLSLVVACHIGPPLILLATMAKTHISVGLYNLGTLLGFDPLQFQVLKETSSHPRLEITTIGFTQNAFVRNLPWFWPKPLSLAWMLLEILEGWDFPSKFSIHYQHRDITPLHSIEGTRERRLLSTKSCTKKILIMNNGQQNIRSDSSYTSWCCINLRLGLTLVS